MSSLPSLKRHYLCKILCGILTPVTLTRFNFCHYSIASRLLVPLTGDFIYGQLVITRDVLRPRQRRSRAKNSLRERPHLPEHLQSIGPGLIRGPGRRITPPGKICPMAIMLSDMSVIPPVASTAARNDNARPLLQSVPASLLSALCQAG